MGNQLIYLEGTTIKARRLGVKVFLVPFYFTKNCWSDSLGQLSLIHLQKNSAWAVGTYISPLMCFESWPQRNNSLKYEVNSFSICTQFLVSLSGQQGFWNMDNGSVRTMLNEQDCEFLGLVCTETLHYFNNTDAVELLWLFIMDSLYFYHQ